MKKDKNTSNTDDKQSDNELMETDNAEIEKDLSKELL